MPYACDHCGETTNNTKEYDCTDRVHHICDKCLNRIHKEVEYQSENQQCREKRVICPHCDHIYKEAASCNFALLNNTEKVICELCGKAFELEVESIANFYFSTKKHLCEMPEAKEATQ